MFFFCYNHDVEHHYFSSREGFQRATMKFQGMVGVTTVHNTTRLTWLVNLDLGGLVPTRSGENGLLGTMIYPRQLVIDVKKQMHGKEKRLAGNWGEVGLQQENEGTHLKADFKQKIQQIEAQIQKHDLRQHSVDKENEELRRQLEKLRVENEELRARLGQCELEGHGPHSGASSSRLHHGAGRIGGNDGDERSHRRP